MRYLRFLMLLLLAAAPLQAEQWTKTFPIAGKAELRVQTSDADIHLDTWDRNSIEARVITTDYKIGDTGIAVFDHQIGDSVQLEVQYPHTLNIWGVSPRHWRVEIEILMPREGSASLSTSDGSIQISHLKGTMDLESEDGSQELDAVEGSIRAQSRDGHIRAAGRFDSFEATTGDGRIDARALPGSNVNSNWSLQAQDGSITLQLPETLSADIDLHTSDGRITLGMPMSVEGKPGHKKVHGKLNGGGNLVTVQTGDGAIRLEKL